MCELTRHNRNVRWTMDIVGRQVPSLRGASGSSTRKGSQFERHIRISSEEY